MGAFLLSTLIGTSIGILAGYLVMRLIEHYEERKHR